MTSEKEQPEIQTSREHRIKAFAGLCFLSFLMMFGYAIARPATESLYLKEYTSKGLPWVWIAIAFTVPFVVEFYNRALQKNVLTVLLAKIVGICSISLLLLTSGYLANIPGMNFALYVWKDVYIVVLISIFWSFANTVFPLKTARWAYGLFCAVGSIAGMLGNLTVGWAAKEFGTVHTLWIMHPLFLGIGLGSLYLSKNVPLQKPSPKDSSEKEKSQLLAGLKTIRKSSYLLLLLALIALTQIAITLIDYQYNHIIEIAYPDTDQRTAIIGYVYASISVISFTLEFTAVWIIRYLGVPFSLLIIPVILATSVGGFALVPLFLTIAIAKVTSKSTNYSIFKVATELLYLPLSYQEKTQGKAVIDVMIYRMAKGVASLLLLLLLWLKAGTSVTYIALGFIAIWQVLTIAINRRYRDKVPREMEKEAASL